MREPWQKEPYRWVICPDCSRHIGSHGRNRVRSNLAHHFRVFHELDREEAKRLARELVPTADLEYR